MSWTVPGTDDWVAWEAPWPFSLVRPEDMFVIVVVRGFVWLFGRM